MNDRTDMEHDTTIEAIELAAMEPGGLDRLMAGDTETSRTVAAHLVGCESCAAALVAVHRDSLVIADVVATTPPADLRARTLATVRRSGVRRGADEALADPAADPRVAGAAVSSQPPTNGPRAPCRSRLRRGAASTWAGSPRSRRRCCSRSA